MLLNEPGSFEGYTLFTPNPGKVVYLINQQGMVAHKWNLLEGNSVPLAKLLDNGNLMLTQNRESGRVMLEIDPEGNIVWEYELYLEGIRQHHDFLKLPNGNVLLLALERKTVESVIAAGANPDYIHEDVAAVEVDYLVEIQPDGPRSGKVVWGWYMWDHLVQEFDPGKPNYGAVADHPELIDVNFALLEGLVRPRMEIYVQDWTHANGIDYNPELDQVVLTVRNFSEIWIIDHSTTSEEAAGHSGGKSGRGGDLLYRWGNPRAYGRGTVEDQRLFWPHNAHWIAPGLPGAGNILIFNNGNGIEGEERCYSSVDEIIPPMEGYGYRMDAGGYVPGAPAWTYQAANPADFYAALISGAQRLPNGNTLICSGREGIIFEVTPEGETVWKYVNPVLQSPSDDGVRRPRFVYRAYRYGPDYPGLQGYELTPGGPVGE